MLGPIMPALGSGNARRQLALAPRRHRTGDSFHKDIAPQGHGEQLITKKPATRRLSKTEREIMKLEVQFGEETRFDKPVRRMIRTWVQLLPGIRGSLHGLPGAKRSNPIRPELNGEPFPEDSSP